MDEIRTKRRRMNERRWGCGIVARRLKIRLRSRSRSHSHSLARCRNCAMLSHDMNRGCHAVFVSLRFGSGPRSAMESCCNGVLNLLRQNGFNWPAYVTRNLSWTGLWLWRFSRFSRPLRRALTSSSPTRWASGDSAAVCEWAIERTSER